MRSDEKEAPLVAGVGAVCWRYLEAILLMQWTAIVCSSVARGCGFEHGVVELAVAVVVAIEGCVC